MTWPMILAALVALLAAHGLRAPVRSRSVMAPVAFVLGVALAAVGVRVAADGFAIKRPDAYDGFLAHAVAQAEAEPDAPLLVFMGTSYTRNGLDDARLTGALRAAGLPHRALNYSLEGASYQERFLRLADLLRALPRAPDAVFLEVAAKYDHRPAYAFEVGKLSNRSLGQFGPVNAGWTAFGISQGACEGAKGCVMDLGLLGVHAGMNALNVGLLSVARPLGDAAPSPSFEPVDTVRTAVGEDERRAGLSERPLLDGAYGPTWAQSFRRQKDQLLHDHGVRIVGYYLPPVVSAEKRNYVSGLCAGEFRGRPCVAPDDPALLERLDADVWFDAEHLRVAGANAYTDWLAGRLIGSGVLADPQRPPGLDLAQAEDAEAQP